MQKSRKKILAVFGNPILHSRSPQIFNAAFKHEQINAFYTRICAEHSEDIGNIIKKHKICGANITTPFKESVLSYVDFPSQTATKIGGANVLINSYGVLYGHNTDHIGVTKSLDPHFATLKNLKCIVLGAGAAAKAAVYGLTQKGANVTIANRTFSKAQHIAKTFECNAISLNELEKHINETEIIVSALLPQANPLQGLNLPKNIVLLDANYRNSAVETYAIKQGCKLVSGKEWLMYQAIETFKLIFNKEPDKAVMEKGFNNNLNLETIKATALNSNTKVVNFQNIDIAICTNLENETVFNNRLNEEKNLLINS